MNGLLTGLLARRETGLIEEIENSDAEMTELRARLAEYEQSAAPVPDIAIEVRNGVSVGVFPSGEIVNPHYARGWNDNNSYRAAMLAKQGMWIAGDDMQLAQYTADKKLITEYKKGILNNLPKKKY